MAAITEKTKVFFLIILIIFVSVVGIFWLDYIGLMNINKIFRSYTPMEAPSVLEAAGDEPSLIAKEEFEKEKEKLAERIEELDSREAGIIQAEKDIEKEKEKLEEMRKGLELEKEKIEKEKSTYSGYKRNVVDLAQKIYNMRPEEAVQRILNLDDTLIIAIFRQMDVDAENEGRATITSYYLELMPKERASRIMYLMTQL